MRRDYLMRALIVGICGVLTAAQVPGNPVDGLINEQQAIVADLKAVVEDLQAFKTDPAKLTDLAVRQTTLHQKIARLTEAQKKELADRKESTIRGTVTRKGKPLADVVLSFYPINGKPRSFASDAQGRYNTKNLISDGDAKVTVQGEGVPEAYSNLRTTPLKLTVKKGPNTFDINIP
jgi:hypothetical protein